MSLNLLRELEIEKNDKELGGLEFNFSLPCSLEITVSRLISAEAVGKILYSIYNKLNYLLDYLDYQIKVKENNLEFSKKTIHEYFSLICSTPFL